MIYILVKWLHNLPDEPVLLYSELDNKRYEIRKVEIYRDGQIGYASNDEAFGSTRLGESPVPHINEIAKDKQFKPITITKEEFESIWDKRGKETSL
jgi:hypothetical protein